MRYLDLQSKRRADDLALQTCGGRNKNKKQMDKQACENIEEGCVSGGD
jgi:hypothetical protein